MAKNDSFKNYSNYLGGREPLKNAILQHPEERADSIYDYMKSQIDRRLWIKPYSEWHKDKKSK